MKPFLFAALALAQSGNSHGQGTVNFSNIGRSVLLDETCPNPGLVPAGSTYMALLYWAPAGVTDESAFMQVGGASPFLAPGVYLGGTRTVPVTPPGAIANFQVRIFRTVDERPGGYSDIVTLQTGNPTSFPPTVPPSLTQAGLQNQIYSCVIPEPSATALGALGALLLWVASVGRRAVRGIDGRG